ncbi:hypothetical protein [Pantoea endophytica]|uniref:hypothetical protein n=1 Tax=Pantoea endophytica TaxID=92488 RepID=UPI002413C26D|nr:hypothetical protein [Pantoea endophytica]
MNNLTDKQVADWIKALRYEKSQGSISLAHSRFLEVLDRMVTAEARVAELQEQIESSELQSIADASADDYYRSEEK